MTPCTPVLAGSPWGSRTTWPACIWSSSRSRRPGDRARRPAGAGRPVLAFGQGEVVYFDDSEQLYFEVPGRGQALCEATSRRLRVAYPEGAGDLWLLSHPFLTIALPSC